MSESQLFSFLLLLLKNCYNFSNFKTAQNSPLTVLEVRNPKINVGLKWSLQDCCVPFRCSRDNWLHSSVCGSESLLPLLLFCLTLTLLSPSYEDPCDYIWPFCIIQDNLPLSRCLISLKSHFYHVRQHIHRFQELKHRHLGVWYFGHHINSNSRKERVHLLENHIIH